MIDRWWEPEGPSLGVSASDLVLLEPGDDPAYDLGAAVFAVHRVGAAACQMVAQTPMLTERTLVEYLGLARQSYAPPVVESIAKCLGDTRYAGLLVRDLADDAERGALDLYRTAVAKGVAPPLAAQRVGMVYGCPADRLGAFKALALVPAANPVALQDAADRALFAYVESVTAAETQSVEVSKDVAFESKINRDSEGQFATKDDTRNKLVAMLGSKTKVEPEVKPTSRVVRQTRKRRVVRTAAKPAVTLKPTQQLARTKTKQQMAQQKAYQQKYTRTRIKEREPAPTEPAPNAFDSIMAQLPSQARDYGPMHLDHDTQLSLFLSKQDFYDLKEAVKETSGKFRIGHVLPASGSVEPTRLYAGEHANQEAGRKVEQIADEDYAGGHALSLHSDEDIDGDPGEYLVNEWFAENPRTRETPELRESLLIQVSWLNDRAGDGGHYILDTEGMATVNELRVVGQPYGTVEGGFDAQSYELDPNEVYEFTGDTESTWDGVAQAMVVVHNIRPVSNPFKKSDWISAEHPRDSEGQFAVKEQTVDLVRLALRSGQRQIQESKVDRVPRVVRKPRKVRTADRSVQQATNQQLASQQIAPTKTRQQLMRPAQATQLLSKQQVRRLQTDNPLPTFGPGRHIVLNGYDWQEILDREGPSSSPPEVIHLTSVGVIKMLADANGYEGDDEKIGLEVVQYHANEMQDASHEDFVPLSGVMGNAHHQVFKGVDLDGEMDRYANAYFSTRPDITDIEMRIIRSASSATYGLEVRGLVGTNRPVIVRSEVEDWSGPLKLVKVFDTEQKSPIFNEVVKAGSEAETVPGLTIETAHYIRPGHEVYALRNRAASGQKPGEGR